MMNYKTEKWRVYFREYRRKNLIRKREIERKYIAKPDVREKRKAYMAKWLKENKDKLKKNRLRRSAKEKTRSKTKEAIKSGKLKRLSCEVCGKKAECHHIDYSQPLNVRWLCRKHHAETHYPINAPFKRQIVHQE